MASSRPDQAGSAPRPGRYWRRGWPPAAGCCWTNATSASSARRPDGGRPHPRRAAAARGAPV